MRRLTFRLNAADLSRGGCSFAIESQLANLPGLAPHWVALNDDCASWHAMTVGEIDN